MSLQKVDICASKNKRLALLFLIFAISLALRLFTITERDLSHDEAYTLYGLSSFENAIDIAKNDNHPPLYFMLFNIIFQSFGESTNIKRAMHAFQGAINSTLIGATAGLLSNDRALIMAGLLSAFCPAQIGPSQRIDYYVWFELLSTLTLLFYVLNARGKKPLSFLTTISIILFFSHYFGIFLIIGIYLTLLLEKKNRISLGLNNNNNDKSFFPDIYSKKLMINILFISTIIVLWMIFLAFNNPVFGFIIGKTDSVVNNIAVFPHHKVNFFANSLSVISRIFTEPFTFDFSVFSRYSNYFIAFFSFAIILIHWQKCKITAYPIIISIIPFAIFSFFILKKTSINHFTTNHLAFIRPAIICTLSCSLSLEKAVMPGFYGLLFWLIFALFPYYGTGYQGSFLKKITFFNDYISANLTENDCFFYSDDIWVRRNINSLRLPDSLKGKNYIPFLYPENAHFPSNKPNYDDLFAIVTRQLTGKLYDKNRIFVFYDYPRRTSQWEDINEFDKNKVFEKGDQITRKDLLADQYLDIIKSWDIKIDFWDIGGGLLMAKIPDIIEKEAKKANLLNQGKFTEKNSLDLTIVINKKPFSATPRLYWNHEIVQPHKTKRISTLESQYLYKIPREKIPPSTDNYLEIMNPFILGETNTVSQGTIKCDKSTILPIITVDFTIFHNPLWRLLASFCSIIATASIIMYLFSGSALLSRKKSRYRHE